jgi:hypothetical protein
LLYFLLFSNDAISNFECRNNFVSYYPATYPSKHSQFRIRSLNNFPKLTFMCISCTSTDNKHP